MTFSAYGKAICGFCIVSTAASYSSSPLSDAVKKHTDSFSTTAEEKLSQGFEKRCNLERNLNDCNVLWIETKIRLIKIFDDGIKRFGGLGVFRSAFFLRTCN